MALLHLNREGLTASEVTLIASGLEDRYNSFSMYKAEVFKDLAECAAIEGYNNAPISLLNSNDKAILLEKALLDHVLIACDYIVAKNNDIPLPEQTSVIKILHRSSVGNNTNNIEMTLESIAIWFQEYDPDKSIIFDPTESYLLEDESEIHSTNESPVFDKDMDNYLNLALKVYDHCWKDLPAGMKNPSKKEIEKYIIDVIGIYNLKGIEEKYVPKLIDSIIKVSAPKNHNFGSPQSGKLGIWQELFNRVG